VNRGTPVLVASCLALAAANFAPERAPAQVTLTPRVIQIDQLKCAELQSGSDQKLDRLLVYFNGYVDGMRRHTVWDERQVGELIDRVTSYCKANPSETLLSAFTRASR
jgi:HdeA/HdeB family